MAEFARYYLELFKAIGQDFLDYWRGVGQAWSEFFYNLSRYFEILRIYSGEFNFWSWYYLSLLSFLHPRVLVLNNRMGQEIREVLPQ